MNTPLTEQAVRDGIEKQALVTRHPGGTGEAGVAAGGGRRGRDGDSRSVTFAMPTLEQVMTASAEDEATLKILQRLPSPADLKSASLVCRRWNRLHGRLTETLKLFDWGMLECGRLAERFPNLTSIDLTPAWSNSPDPEAFGEFAVYMTRGINAMRLDPQAANPLSAAHSIDEQSPTALDFDRGLRALVAAYPLLRRLHLVDVFRAKEIHKTTNKADVSKGGKGGSSKDVPTHEGTQYSLDGTVRASDGQDENEIESRGKGGATDLSSASASSSGMSSPSTRGSYFNDDYVDRKSEGLEIVALGCPALQELELRQCTDLGLETLGTGFRNLQVVKLVGMISGFYHAAFTDRGLRVLSRACPRIVELSLHHGSVGYEGLATLAKECPMLSVLSLGGRSFRPDWLKALSLCSNLQVLRLEGFHQADAEKCSGQGQRPCTSLERLQLAHCDVRPKSFFFSLLSVCEGVKEVELRNCWGLKDDAFAILSLCRKIRRLDVEGCPHLTTMGLEAVVVDLPGLRQLSVRRCIRVREEEISEALADVIFSLKELKWEPGRGQLQGAKIMLPGRVLPGPG